MPASKRIVITGVSRGLGRALVDGFIDTDMLRSCFGANAANYPGPAASAAKAVPFLLSLGPKDNGRPMEVPE
ncbi:MAG: hypothetical protein ABSG86_31230 [Thermoguttaceae bacterium]|jgi:hypothetical protein